MNDYGFHTPVLLEEVIDFLSVRPGKRYIDATAGGGGHTLGIIRSGGEVLGIDRDPAAIAFARKKLVENLPAGYAGSFRLVRGNFNNLKEIATKNDFVGVDGILMDIGISSYHLDFSKRGFTFRHNEPLDMRMNPNAEKTAAEVLNSYPEKKLYEVFLRYGEEQLAEQLAHRLAGARRVTPITTTNQLVELISSVAQDTHHDEKKMVTTAFQAIRIEVNDELENLKRGLESAVDLLNPGGRLAIISFHSLEDRIVKLFFKKESRLSVITNKPVIPTEQEVQKNRRSRSARMRVAERLKKI